MKRKEIVQAIQALGVAYGGMALGAIATHNLPALWHARTEFWVLLPGTILLVAMLVTDVWRWRPDDGSRGTFAVRVTASAIIVLVGLSLIVPPPGPCPTCPPKILARRP